MRAIANGGNRRQNVRNPDLPHIPANTGAPGGEIDFDAMHAGQRGNMPFIEPDTCRAGNALDHQRSFPLVFVEFTNETFLEFSVVVERQLVEHIRYCLALRQR